MNRIKFYSNLRNLTTLTSTDALKPTTSKNMSIPVVNSFLSKHVQSWLLSFINGNAIGLLELDKSVFGASLREDLIKRALVYEQSWREQGTESTKNLGFFFLIKDK